MLKKIYGKKLSRARKARGALFRSLIKAFVKYGQITTTRAKAKAIQGQIDKLMTKTRVGTLAARREVFAYLANDQETTAKLFGELKPMANAKQSGFTRIIALPPRRGDRAEVVRLEWAQPTEIKKTKKENPPSQKLRRTQ